MIYLLVDSVKNPEPLNIKSTTKNAGILQDTLIQSYLEVQYLQITCTCIHKPKDQFSTTKLNCMYM